MAVGRSSVGAIGSLTFQDQIELTITSPQCGVIGRDYGRSQCLISFAASLKRPAMDFVKQIHTLVLTSASLSYSGHVLDMWSRLLELFNA
jgi:hypothetical protein